jgi:uncharacterized repeat protein (TIGR03837 family)
LSKISKYRIQKYRTQKTQKLRKIRRKESMSENASSSNNAAAKTGTQATVRHGSFAQENDGRGLRWSIFCRVIDNFGDIGVCWRLSRALATRGHLVRLWVDDATALAWMAPAPVPGVQVMRWQQDWPLVTHDWQSDVIVEAFGCELDPNWVKSQFAIKNIANYVINTPADGIFKQKNPVWINLEYLSAESYVQRSHGLMSPVLSGVAQGLSKWFFYPGFTAGTGGLIQDWPAAQSSAVQPDSEQLSVSLFCYESPAVAQLLQHLERSEQPVRLHVTPGRAAQAVGQALEARENSEKSLEPLYSLNSLLSISYLDYSSQDQYDTLLARCSFNIVRGEDSLVRALLAGKAFAWHIYPQSDGAHAAKLDAFLDWLQAPPSLRQFMRVWNALAQGDLPPIELQAWTACAQAARRRILAQSDLLTQLIDFVQEKRTTA